MRDIILIVGIVFSSAMLGSALTASYENDRLEKVTNNSLENMENLKRDCEKSLPRDKVCVMVFDYVEVTNDYEQ